MRYIGDDLINLMTVTIHAEDGEELPEIETVELKIGCLDKKFNHPTNPFVVDIMRGESVKLSTKNKVFAAIWYWGEVEGKRKLLKKTCEGVLTFPLNTEVVNGGCKC